ncbi:aminotransferase class V-fold PLP-dependent enzyme [Marinomonas sp. 2405UD68-3]|uniref:aminotransferase class V-fold PLP-dependent enzyme n=1 Tax=Marinomonas sp. 2405UD68-3 TaxID=3391835 RepID=UPI0039C97CBA
MNNTNAADYLSEHQKQTLLHIRNNIIGDNTYTKTPFGERKLTYADYTASGRSLAFIEKSITQSVLPFYANTHTESTITGKQTTRFREDAREIIRKAVNATSDYFVIFCGSGATSAVNKLISMMNFPLLKSQHGVNPVVFIGPYEHHSNDLPWRESSVDLVRISESPSGGLNLAELKNELIRYKDRPIKIGSFSAASNVTGIKTDQNSVSALLHQYNALSFWDFAAAAPYVDIDMNPQENSLHYKDAIFFSCHKFIGGPSTPGILVIKKSLINNSTPSIIGGGTVSFVSQNIHSYLDISEAREEGGTPSIIESIRAGMVFKLKSDIGPHTIERLEEEYVNQIEDRWRNHSTIELLGVNTRNRLTITSFRIHTKEGYLHHDFIVALLNDLFGLQVRSGCSCAGPYGHDLLNIDDKKSSKIISALSTGNTIIKPGWVRFNLNYFLPQEEVDFIFSAIEFVAENGAILLPFYQYDTINDMWLFQGACMETQSLDDIYRIKSEEASEVTLEQKVALWNSYLTEANNLIDKNTLGIYNKYHQPFNDSLHELKDFILANSPSIEKHKHMVG